MRVVIEARRVTVHTRNGTRHFDRVGSRPYVTKDGEALDLLEWQGSCVDCGAPFVVTTSPDIKSSKAFGLARCRQHRARTARGA